MGNSVTLVVEKPGQSTCLIASSARCLFDAADFCTMRLLLFCLVAGPEVGAYAAWFRGAVAAVIRGRVSVQRSRAEG